MRHSSSASHLPINELLIPDIFSFTHVKGIARIFLIIEMVLASLVVIGTLILAILRFL